MFDVVFHIIKFRKKINDSKRRASLFWHVSRGIMIVVFFSLVQVKIQIKKNRLMASSFFSLFTDVVSLFINS